ncbi:hypothetical protein F7P75_09050 [Acinetobacter gandensis]|nr:hypothetical protein F7P75_09050 [Acinetobacter gandensis]
MTIKKASSLTKLEDLGRIQLSKSFFMRDFYPHPLAQQCRSSQREKEKSLPIKYFYKINIGSSLSF